MTTYILPTLIFAVIGLTAGVLLVAVSKAFAVPTDERFQKIRNALPGVNCGACGFSGCDAYADAIANDKDNTIALNLCSAGGATTAKTLGTILGVDAGIVEDKVAVVHCRGFCNATAVKYDFLGISSCAAANRFYNGSKVCTHSCLGLGDCAAVCPNGAISFRDQLAYIDKSKCVGCGLCVKACPNGILQIHNRKNLVHVLCSSTEMGQITRSVCSNGCIGCGICQKKCPKDAISIKDNLAHIDLSLCINCGLCTKACPTGAIVSCKSTDTAIKPRPLPTPPKKELLPVSGEQKG